MLISLVIALLAAYIVRDYFNKKHRNELLARFNITGPKTLPVLGNALDLRRVNTENVNEFIKSNFQKYGRVYRFWVLNQMHVRISDPKYFELILTNPQILKKSNFYDFLSDWLGRGLLLSDGRKWQNRRKILTPAFHFKILEQFVEIFNQQSGIMVKKLYDKADGKTAIDMCPVLCPMALDVIAETAMGVKIQAQGNPELEYVKALNYVSNIMSQRFINPTQRTSLLFWLSSPRIYNETQRCIKIMHAFSMDVIEKRRKSLKDTPQQKGKIENQNTSDEEYYGKQRLALLDILLQSTINGVPLTNEDIREEVDNFMFAGHDTTTSSMSFALYLIARHPKVQNRLMEEIEEVLGKNTETTASYRDLQALKYMECVIKESLRLYPSVPAIGREISEDTKLGDITLPAKTNVILSFSLVMRDAAYFPNPDDFMPERFMGDKETGPYQNPFLFTPFSAGVRNCLGQRFAMLEMKSVISKLLRHFELLPLGPEVQPIINIVLRSKTGAHIGLRPRKFDT